VQTREKPAKQRQAANELATIMYSSLEKFSEEERNRRLDAIHKLSLKMRPSRKKYPKRVSKRANPRQHPLAAVAQHSA